VQHDSMQYDRTLRSKAVKRKTAQHRINRQIYIAHSTVTKNNEMKWFNVLHASPPCLRLYPIAEIPTPCGLPSQLAAELSIPSVENDRRNIVKVVSLILSEQHGTSNSIRFDESKTVPLHISMHKDETSELPEMIVFNRVGFAELWPLFS
jgi:hypothetical protein